MGLVRKYPVKGGHPEGQHRLKHLLFQNFLVKWASTGLSFAECLNFCLLGGS